ncbi:putative histone-lysine N-methyltransferase PRDM9-like [Penaeus vannamei]|uniref:Putative histone-lysine N-methyltransferase PRDM9-like n=1 Tax=Penaeus vannamei TaxID=6689 RepID=A0A3R7M335_PENVA|nr:putative histone-lysine N-methyltransferase PRDM9-like [Penaeus vannamei]
MEPSDKNVEESDVKSVKQEESLWEKRTDKRSRKNGRGKRAKPCRAQLSASQEEVAHLWKAARLAPAPGNSMKVILTAAESKKSDSSRSRGVCNGSSNTSSSKATEMTTYSYKLRSRYGYEPLDYVVEDTFIFCHWCRALCEGVCQDHPPLLVLNKEVPRDGSRSDRARQTTPWPLRVAESPIAGAGMGVFTSARLPPGLVFGPYEGRIRTDPKESGYAWQVRSPSHKKKTVDSVDASVSNWMRYVNCSKTDVEANLEAFQFLGNIYYLIVTYIEVNSELLVWYGDEYGQALQSAPDSEIEDVADGNAFGALEAGGNLAGDGRSSPDKKKIKTEDAAEARGESLSLSQHEMEPLFTPVVLERAPDGSAQIQIAASEPPGCSQPRGHSGKKAPQQYRKFDCTYCVVCKKTIQGICSKHPMPLLRDAPVPRDGSVKERARLTAPWPLVVCQSHSQLKARSIGKRPASLGPLAKDGVLPRHLAFWITGLSAAEVLTKIQRQNIRATTVSPNPPSSQKPASPPALVPANTDRTSSVYWRAAYSWEPPKTREQNPHGTSASARVRGRDLLRSTITRDIRAVRFRWVLRLRTPHLLPPLPPLPSPPPIPPQRPLSPTFYHNSLPFHCPFPLPALPPPPLPALPSTLAIAPSLSPLRTPYVPSTEGHRFIYRHLQNTELLVWYGDAYGSWLIFPLPQLLSGDGNDHLGVAGGSRQNKRSAWKRTRSRASARDRELRRQDPARGSATEMTEGPTKGPSDSRRETSAEDRCRTVVKVRCPSGYASIVELGFEKPQNKGSGVALLAGPSWEDIPSSRNLQQGAAPAFPVALTASAVCDKYLDDSKCMSLPGTKEMISIPCNNNREISQQGPVKEASPATTASVSESIPRRSKDAGIVGSPAGATHQSVIGLGSPQDQKLKVKRTEDLHANRSAKLKLPSESNTRGKVLGIQRIIPEESFRSQM